jgi:hypothetical protein
MSPARRVKTRTQLCTPEQAHKRLVDAREFLELAELAGEESDVTSFNVAAANAALAGVAAAGRRLLSRWASVPGARTTGTRSRSSPRSARAGRTQRTRSGDCSLSRTTPSTD